MNILATKDPAHPGFAHVLALLETFRAKSANGDHLCQVSEVTGGSLEAMLGRFPGGKVPLSIAKQIARQVLSALDYIHDCGIIHCGNFLIHHRMLIGDIQQVNILATPKGLKSPILSEPAENSDIDISSPLIDTYQPDDTISVKISDFDVGGVPFPISLTIAMPVNHRKRGIVPPEALRAPEVTLGLSWGTAIDIWSFGCVVWLPLFDMLLIPRCTSSLHIRICFSRVGKSPSNIPPMRCIYVK